MAWPAWRARNRSAPQEPPYEPAALHKRAQSIDDCTWSIDNADRLTVLIDAKAYYNQLDRCFRHAQTSIYINGWDLDTCIPLTPMSSAQSLADFIEEQLADRPDLQVHILLWQMIAVQASNRGLPPFRKSWRDHPRMHFRYDMTRPVESSRHEKIVVVDRTIAFMGSTDISRERWDIPGHGAEAAPYRINGDGEPYRPHHDLQAMLTGPAAVRLADYVESAWNVSVGAEAAETSADNCTAEEPASVDGAAHASTLDDSTIDDSTQDDSTIDDSTQDDSTIDDSTIDESTLAGSTLADSTIEAFWPNSIPVQFHPIPVHFSRTAPEFADSPGNPGSRMHDQAHHRQRQTTHLHRNAVPDVEYGH